MIASASTASDASWWTTISFLAVLSAGVMWILFGKLRPPAETETQLDLPWETIGMSWIDLIHQNPGIEIALKQIEGACDFFRTKRLKAKRDAELVLIATYIANGAVMVIGVASLWGGIRGGRKGGSRRCFS